MLFFIFFFLLYTQQTVETIHPQLSPSPSARRDSSGFTGTRPHRRLSLRSLGLTAAVSGYPDAFTPAVFFSSSVADGSTWAFPSKTYFFFSKFKRTVTAKRKRPDDFIAEILQPKSRSTAVLHLIQIIINDIRRKQDENNKTKATRASIQRQLTTHGRRELTRYACSV